MLPTGEAYQDDLHRLFKPGPHVFKDASIPISLIGPHVVDFLLSPPNTKTLEVAFLLSKAISGCDESDLTSLLRSAAQSGNSYFVSALIYAGADLNHRDSNDQSVMSLAIQSGNTDSIVVNLADFRGLTALHVAAIRGYVDSLQFFVSIGGDPDLVDHNGWTPLHCAVNHSTFSKYAVTREGKTSFALAVEKGHSHLYDLLQLGDSLQRAARIDDIHSMKSCLVEGGKVDAAAQGGILGARREREALAEPRSSGRCCG
ncbi:protein VAPYRIN-LIKE-like [Actinidia eriantha]|uniref:protein VAPYRIN-LIKE-like n=1 Tax=Actinidia eriantha TaxID=165200 RepID=UPI00258CDEAB|nr:protein VAPYRIN-LIKE-like [Actinidia eriantha]